MESTFGIGVRATDWAKDGLLDKLFSGFGVRNRNE